MMQVTETIWQNGNLVPWNDAKVHVLSHTLHYGGGAFEGIRFYKTSSGPAIFRLEDHINRLFYSASVLKMTIPYSKEEVIAAVKDVVLANRLEAGYIRPLAFYGYGKMGVNPIGNPTDLIIACWPWGAYLPHDSIDVKISNFIRIHPDSTVVDAKICGHYVNSILASLELQGTHYHEALLLDGSGHIMEGVGENFFIVKNGKIYTPKLGGILSGITRDTVIKLTQQLGLELFEADITIDEAYQADEAFFTGTAAEITAIRSINDRQLGKNGVGKVSATIKQAYLDLVHGKNSELMHYLTYL
ncbi:branched-chain amino acid transaminase [Legionella hackeliae]|uniref:Branched-chain-amino-acid aminotransferase n=1 Tax=Legionella hackeliae TaxID=449 RepID=A0A0A8UPN2_LEGHA|nr:branched-chain amino acid transaminase [Legionella hackeliae]KTD11479.1 D-alanine-aminotransferase [Legionella hackeliae]CEK10688.1 Branched-chain-amino-acid aminotransferase [Legionella hackeliae]STX47435.1 D-alanine transaminase [Legionella hackeliae]